MVENLLLIVHLVMAVSLIVLVLLQQGKGAQAGAAFGGGGGGSSQSLFGARGSANFMTRTTAIVATVFFVTTLTLAYLYASRTSGSSVVTEGSVLDQMDAVEQVEPVSDVPQVSDVPVVSDGADETQKVDATGGDVPSLESTAEPKTQKPAVPE